jgi:tripartite-type tricarboxylate transporter receptor subunit TctC
MTNSVRAPAEPDIPTVQEAGYPELSIDGLVGFFGPSDMASGVRERIAADIRAVITTDPIIPDRLVATGQILNPGGPAEFASAIDAQRAKIAAIAKDLGVKPMQ